MTTVRPQVVALLLDVGPLDFAEVDNRSMTHADGKPVTDAEYDVLAQATLAELKAYVELEESLTRLYGEGSR